MCDHWTVRHAAARKCGKRRLKCPRVRQCARQKRCVLIGCFAGACLLPLAATGFLAFTMPAVFASLALLLICAKTCGDETESIVPSLKRPKSIFDRLEEAARNQAEEEPGTYAIVPDSFGHGPPDGRRIAFWWTRSMHVLQEKLKAFREKFPDACLLSQWQKLQKRLIIFMQ